MSSRAELQVHIALAHNFARLLSCWQRDRSEFWLARMRAVTATAREIGMNPASLVPGRIV